ncbi:MAG: ABC transporter permease [Bacteroidales bacterium]|nr:ABC transporter permease [Bacteroidales bacterium]
MKAFIGFVRKEFYHIVRDYRTLLVLFGMPVAQMLIFGFVISTEIRNVNIAIYDQSNDVYTRQITDRLISSGYFRLYQRIRSPEQIRQAFRSGKVKEVVVYEPDFAGKLLRNGLANVQIIADASDANQAHMMVGYTSEILFSCMAAWNKNAPLPATIQVKPRMLYNENLSSAYMFVPGTMAMILMLICTLMTSISIVREKETGSMEVLLASPLRPFQIIGGKVVPYIILSLVNAISVIFLGVFVFGVPVHGSLLLLLFECLLYISLALSIGIFISTVTSSQQLALFLSMLILMLPTILLSGFIFPVESMPAILQWICHLMPPKYFITILKDIMLKGTGIDTVWLETLVLLGMTVLFFAISIRRFQIRLHQ